MTDYCDSCKSQQIRSLLKNHHTLASGWSRISLAIRKHMFPSFPPCSLPTTRFVSVHPNEGTGQVGPRTVTGHCFAVLHAAPRTSNEIATNLVLALLKGSPSFQYPFSFHLLFPLSLSSFQLSSLPLALRVSAQLLTPSHAPPPPHPFWILLPRHRLSAPIGPCPTSLFVES